MDIIHIANKGKMLDTLEKFYIYKGRQSGNQINNKLTVQKNLIFEVLIQHTPYRGQHLICCKNVLNVTVIHTRSTLKVSSSSIPVREKTHKKKQ